MSAWRLSLGLFTILPVGRVSADPDPSTIRRAILLAPVVGAGIGLMGAAVLFASRLAVDRSFTAAGSQEPLAVLLASAIAITVVLMLSGGLHADGLADTVDGLACRGDAERTLAVMRDPAVGALGALALVLLVLLDTVALAVCVMRGHGTEALLTAVVAGRVAIVWGCTGRAARPEGLGAWVARSVRPAMAAAVTAVALVVPLATGLIDDDGTARSLTFALIALPLSVVIAVVASWGIRRRIGGISGDVLGAMAQVATTIALLLIACSP